MKSICIQLDSVRIYDDTLPEYQQKVKDVEIFDIIPAKYSLSEIAEALGLYECWNALDDGEIVTKREG
jgi:hypothetical protein